MCVCVRVLICCSVREEYHVSVKPNSKLFLSCCKTGNKRERERERDLLRHDD